MKQYWKYTALLTCGLVLGLLLGRGGGQNIKPPEDIPKNARSAWLIIETQEEGEKEAWSIESKENVSLFQTMDELAKNKKIEMKAKEFPGLGTMIEDLEGRKNGDEGKYWQYWVNEEYAKVGADAYIPEAGDIIEWRFTNQQNF